MHVLSLWRTDQRLQLHPSQGKVRTTSIPSPRWIVSYSSIPSFSEYPLTGQSGQRLGASYNAIGAMDDTPPTWEGDELGISCWVDGFRVERHDEDVSKLNKYRVCLYSGSRNECIA